MRRRYAGGCGAGDPDATRTVPGSVKPSSHGRSILPPHEAGGKAWRPVHCRHPRARAMVAGGVGRAVVFPDSDFEVPGANYQLLSVDWNRPFVSQPSSFTSNLANIRSHFSFSRHLRQ